jgi:hypothetical protein
MITEEIVQHYPRLYHMAQRGSWESIRRHGLLSTHALINLYEVEDPLRVAILTERRPASVELKRNGLETAVVRDQIPLRVKSLESCLTDMSLGQWLNALNSRVFFWLDYEHLETLLSAKAYRDDAHDVLTIDTASLVEREADKIRLSPINSGSTIYKPQPRGSQTFLPIAEYPFIERRKKRGRNAIVELAVEGGVQDIEEVALRVERRRCGGVIEEILWEGP